MRECVLCITWIFQTLWWGRGRCGLFWYNYITIRFLGWLQICLPVQETQETWVQSPGSEDPLEEEKATIPIFLPRKPHGQRSLVGYGWSATGHRVRHDWEHSLLLIVKWKTHNKLEQCWTNWNVLSPYFHPAYYVPGTFLSNFHFISVSCVSKNFESYNCLEKDAVLFTLFFFCRWRNWVIER